jgi:hypothetical protein
MLRNKKWYIVLGVAGALVLLLGGVGIAYAQRPRPASEGELFLGGGLSRDAGPFGGQTLGRAIPQAALHRGLFRGSGPLWALVGVTADVTGLSEEDVVTALKDGQPIAAIAESQDVDPQEIVDAAVAQAEARLQEAVDNGRLTEEQMDRILERLAEELPERLEEPWEPGGPAGGVLGRFGEGFWTAYDAVAEVLGLEPEALFTELHDGKTMVEIAQEQDVEMEEVREALEEAGIEARKKAIERAVEDGRLTQERADWMIEGLEEGFVPGRRGIGRGRGFRLGNKGCGRGRGW